MARSLYNTDLYREKLDSVSADVLRNVRINKGFLIWMGILTISLAACIYAYSIQLHKGLGVTGLRDATSWGMYIATFVFLLPQA